MSQENNFKYRVYEDDGDEHCYMRLNKLETNSIIEALSYQQYRGAHGIEKWTDGDWVEIGSTDVSDLFYQELKELMSTGQIDKLRDYLKYSSSPPQEFLDFINKDFKNKPLFQIHNPYHLNVVGANKLDNLITSFKKERQA